MDQALPRVHPQIYFSPDEKCPAVRSFRGLEELRSSLVDLEQLLPAHRPEQPQDLLSIAEGKVAEANVRRIRKLESYQTT
jgi:hypothetical protein